MTALRPLLELVRTARGLRQAVRLLELLPGLADEAIG